MVTNGNYNMVASRQFNHYSISPQNATAITTNRRLHAFAGSSLLRVSSSKKKVENVETETKESNKENVTCSNLETDNIQGNDNTNVQGNAPIDRCHKLSPRSRKKLFNRAYSFIRAQKVSSFPFITFTFIDAVSDKDGVQILNKFLTSVRKQYPDFEYIWVAERQNKNGRGVIHFHLISNTRLCVFRYNYLWLLCQYNNGLRLPNVELSDLHKEYALHGKVQHINNSFDIRTARSINGVTAYLVKYISKNQDTFNCAVWHCSRNVSKLCTSQSTTKEVWDKLDDKTINNFTSKKGKYYEVSDYKSDWAIVRSILNKDYYDQFMNDLHLVNEWILKGRDNDQIPEVKNKEFVLFHLTKD